MGLYWMWAWIWAWIWTRVVDRTRVRLDTGTGMNRVKTRFVTLFEGATSGGQNRRSGGSGWPRRRQRESVWGGEAPCSFNFV